MRLIVEPVASLLLMILCCSPPGHAAGPSQDPAGPPAVPAEDYPLYDLVVEQKFLTSETRVVWLDRLTLVRLHPDQEDPLSAELFQGQGLFDGRLPLDAVEDFISRNHAPAQFEARFQFGVPYRLVTGNGPERQEASPIRWPVAAFGDERGEGASLDLHLGFSRVGYDRNREQALVYVQYDRLGGGAGFMMRLTRSGARWDVAETEVLWTAGPVPVDP